LEHQKLIKTTEIFNKKKDKLEFVDSDDL